MAIKIYRIEGGKHTETVRNVKTRKDEMILAYTWSFCVMDTKLFERGEIGTHYNVQDGTAFIPTEFLRMVQVSVDMKDLGIEQLEKTFNNIIEHLKELEEKEELLTTVTAYTHEKSQGLAGDFVDVEGEDNEEV